MGKIILKNIELFGFHGPIPEEKKIGCKYTVNLEIDLDLQTASIKDDLNQTVNYVILFQIIKEEMKIRSNLIETVAKRIIKKIQKIKKIKHIKIRLCKINPPICGVIKKFCVELNE
ncbi:dihydroneopterin aldolase [Blattabacterium cuenoti]|uniref:dihydroneopterin aldolase n=1 Tax=Blattabacterium cuenoti TaxID=1653831 RepID=UPI00163D01ED|nr:dihydroneopterin aldolase [Blattabacterium cuenoti]